MEDQECANCSAESHQLPLHSCTQCDQRFCGQCLDHSSWICARCRTGRAEPEELQGEALLNHQRMGGCLPDSEEKPPLSETDWFDGIISILLTQTSEEVYNRFTSLEKDQSAQIRSGDITEEEARETLGGTAKFM